MIREHLGINEVVGENSLGMEACGVSALLDIDRTVVSEIATTRPNLSPRCF
jgi:hypothetical protein